MQKIYLILLPLLLLFSVQSSAQHTKPRLDRKMQRQLEKNDKYYVYEKGWLWLDSTQTTLIENWKWHGDEKPIYVDMLHCKDEKLTKYIKRKVCNIQNNMTILEREYFYPIFRIDSVNNELIICAHNRIVTFDDEIHNNIAIGVSRNELKGVCKIDSIYVFIYGNMVNQYFDIIENTTMPSPLPKHKSILLRKYSGEGGFRLKDLIYSNGYALYKKGRIKNRHYDKSLVYVYDDSSFREYIQDAQNKVKQQF